jgi:hypothetical protein
MRAVTQRLLISIVSRAGKVIIGLWLLLVIVTAWAYETARHRAAIMQYAARSGVRQPSVSVSRRARPSRSPAAPASGSETSASRAKIPRSPTPERALPSSTAGSSRIVAALPSDPVRITGVALSSTVLHSGDTVTATVYTTTNAASAVARVGSFAIALPRLAPGLFRVTLQVPKLLLPVRDFDVVVTAIRADGSQTQASVPITYWR